MVLMNTSVLAVTVNARRLITTTAKGLLLNSIYLAFLRVSRVDDRQWRNDNEQRNVSSSKMQLNNEGMWKMIMG